MKKTLSAFNEGLSEQDQMSGEAAVNIHRHAYKAASVPSMETISIEVKHEAIQKLRASKRSLEETKLLKEEMKHCLEYYQQRITSLRSTQENIASKFGDQGANAHRVSGSNCLVLKKINVSMRQLSKLQDLFRDIVPGTFCSCVAVEYICVLLVLFNLIIIIIVYCIVGKFGRENFQAFGRKVFE